MLKSVLRIVPRVVSSVVLRLALEIVLALNCWNRPCVPSKLLRIELPFAIAIENCQPVIGRIAPKGVALDKKPQKAL